ncbi:MAG TPA: S8 family serine peptidase [Candidatus Limnocylindrales bacterium]|nr:S8 family serine peptidase [Candidatus Limnocylindrales bacterium]
MHSRIRRSLAALAIGALLGSLASVAPAALAGTDQTYLVVYKSLAVPRDAGKTIRLAGGVLTASYDAIGVAVATSGSSAFEAALAKDSRVELAAPTGGTVVRLEDLSVEADDGAAAIAEALPVADTDTLSGLQWDMRQIHTPEAHAITGGSADVLVGDLDTGLDWAHPDLAANVDFANSASCVGGVANQDPAAWRDDNGHGTHTAGTIAAAANGIGIVGVAPNVRIAGIKVGNSSGFFYPEAVVCAFMWAGTHGFDVTNNSYFADPYLFNCKNDPVQRAIFKAEQRAIRFALSNGTVVVASLGNENQDLAKTNIDSISPDDSTPITREVTNACVRIPAEIPGVIGVSANGNLEQKSYYSDYGVGVADVVAPGGDRRFQVTAEAANGRVLSTWPSYISGGSLAIQENGAWYTYLQGTSMAGPHVTGLAALIRSQHPDLSVGAVAALIKGTADPVACPPNPFTPGGTDAFYAWCTGGPAYNGFYGHGQINALTAIE